MKKKDITKKIWILVALIILGGTGIWFHLQYEVGGESEEDSVGESQLAQPVGPSPEDLQEVEARLQQIDAEIREEIIEDQKPLDLRWAQKEFANLQNKSDAELEAWWQVARKLRNRVQRGQAPLQQKQELLTKIDSLLAERISEARKNEKIEQKTNL